MKSSFGKIKVKVYMDKKSYNGFLKQIEVAENYARIHKLGIWANNFSTYPNRKED